MRRMPTSANPTPRVLIGVRLPLRLVDWIKTTADKRGMTVQRFVEQRLTMDRIRIRGTRHRFTLHAESKAEAAEWATAKHKELTRQTDRLREGFPAPVTMTALFDKFETDY